MSYSHNKLYLFFTELKRRGVTRLVAVYAVVALGVVEASDIIGGRFQFPDWTIKAIIIIAVVGFPVALILGWIYDVTSKGIVKTKPITDTEQASLAKMGWKPSWISIILLVILLFTTTAFFIVPRPNALGFKGQDWILIADLENNTREEVFDRSLIHALTVTINQSKRINVYPRIKVLEVLERMQIDSVEIIDVPLSMEIAERENIKAVLQLSISEVGGTYLLIADLLDPYSGEMVRSRQIKASGIEHVLQALNNLAKIILKDLGESLQQIHLGSVPLLRATTASLDALRFMTQGFNSSGSNDEVYRLYSEAIKLDPDFALAHVQLGYLYYTHNNRTKGEEHFNLALKQLHRLTDRERLWIQAIIPEMRGNREEATTRWDLFLSEFPNDYGGWYRKAYNYMRMQQYEESIEAFTRAAEIYQEKDPGVLINIASCYNLLQNYQQAIDFYLEAFEVDPGQLTNANINNEFGFTYVQVGETGKAREVFEEMIKGNDEDKAKGYRSLALLSMYTGQISEAIEQIQESTLFYKTLGHRLSELRNQLYLAKMYEMKGMEEEFFMILNQVNDVIYSIATEPVWYLILGKMYVRNGEYQETEQLIQEIAARSNEGNKWDEAAHKILTGELDLARGNLTEAEVLFETASKLRRDGFALESLANFYYSTGDLEKAVVEYENICGLLNSTGWEAQECWVRAHFSLGEIHEKNGNTQEAINWYQRFLTIWTNADEDLTGLIEAKSSLEELQTGNF